MTAPTSARIAQVHTDYCAWLNQNNLPPAAIKPAIQIKLALGSCFAPGVNNEAFIAPLTEHVRELQAALAAS